MKKQNLFNYATSELSQDAFICWLLSWGEPEASSLDSDLHGLSHKLLQAFFDKHSRKFPDRIESIDIRKQYQNIDILLIVNNSIAIPIEDKIHSREHSDQLSRYLKALKDERYSEENLLPIYLQTGEQGDYKRVTEAGFIPFLRQEMLNILKAEAHTNNILSDYVEFLEDIEKRVQSFKSLQLEEWDWYSWTGFYKYLQEKLEDGEWGYVSNPSGGFLGFWWYWNGDEECEQYLQLEENKLCFKIAVDDETKRTDLKWKWNERILEAAKDSCVNVIKPVLRNGQCMTVAVFDGDYRQSNGDGKIDLEKTMLVIQEAQRILDKAVA